MRTGEKTVAVQFRGEPVGRLALSTSHLAAFQYDPEWIANGFSISPFSLPLKNTVFIPKSFVCEGLFGVFADSLPAAWGRLLLDRMLQSKGIDLNALNVLDRLSIVGSNGMGALEYYPEYDLESGISDVSLDRLASDAEKLLESVPGVHVDELFARGGSSGGARPKAYVSVDGAEWIVKFPYSKDVYNTGKLEYEYSLLAKSCGIEMTETRLFPSEQCDGYFGTKRFDRPKVHMISAAALLEIDFERSLADYADLFKLTSIMTKGSRYDLEQMYLRMCFNVLMDNQDDHLKNFSFVFDEGKAAWKLSPAYDLTKILSGYGEHTTTVNGKGKNITEADLILVGRKAGLSERVCRELLTRVKKQCE